MPETIFFCSRSQQVEIRRKALLARDAGPCATRGYACFFRYDCL
jgi:hypothetical protein